jgi:phosphoglycolate phosphatase-like HAD superfamily hydrolase
VRDIVVFDIDGTLSLVGDRLKHLAVDDWDSFYEAVEEDEVNLDIAAIYNAMHLSGWNIMFVTGRRESVREKTMNWLDKHGLLGRGVSTANLLMRKDGDKRHDTLVKPELVQGIKDRIVMIFEDRASMVDEWRRLGYTTLQVAKGDF